MNQAAMNLPVTAKYSLTFVNGERKGTRFKLAATKITLGRSSENNISFEFDSKCSRQHAVIEFGDQGYEIDNLNPNNPMLINGQEVDHAILKDGAILQLGDTQLKFEIQISNTNNELQASPLGIVSPNGSPPPTNKVKKKKSKIASNSRKKSPLFKVAIVMGVLFFAWLLFSESGPKKPTVDITSERDIDAEIAAAKQIKQAKEKQANEANKNTVQYQDAQANYVKGFRDYEKGSYGRAKDAFQTCLSLYPAHVLCQRYLNLSNRRFNEIVQYHMILGRDYRDRNQFQSCMNSLKTVMVMVKDKNSKIYQQAKANYDACSAELGVRF